MKKLISVFVAVIMAFSVICVNAVAFAETSTVLSPSGTTKVPFKPADPTTNGSGQKPTYSVDPSDPNHITFVAYPSEGETIKWIFPEGAVEGKDYIIIKTDANTIEIKVLNEDLFSKVSMMAYVTTSSEPEEETTEEEAEEVEEKDKSGTSPKTGVVSLAGVSAAAIGLGVSVLALSKKKDEE